MKELDIITTLESNQPTLSAAERERIWGNIATTQSTPAALPSPFLFHIILQKSMIPLAIFIILALGGGATTFASDAARPGDFLYPLDRTIENTRLALTSDTEERARLTQKFTEERVTELREIVDEEIVLTPSNFTALTNLTQETASSTLNDLTIDAYIYTDTTVIKLELDNNKFYFESTATATPDIIVAIQERFPVLSDTQINDVLAIEIEARASRPKDRAIVSLSEEGEARIKNAVGALLVFLDETELEDNQKEAVMALLTSEVSGVTKPAHIARVKDRFEIGDDESKVAIRINDNGDSRIEIRDEENRVQVSTKNGESSIKTETQKPSDDNTEILSTSTIPGFDFEARAEIFTDTTIIRVEIDGEKIYLESDAVTRAAIIADIQKRFSVISTDQIDAELTVKVRNRVSQPEDQGLTSVPVITTPTKTYDDEDEEEYEEDDRTEQEDEHEEDERDNREEEEDEHDD